MSASILQSANAGYDPSSQKISNLSPIAAGSLLVCVVVAEAVSVQNGAEFLVNGQQVEATHHSVGNFMPAGTVEIYMLPSSAVEGATTFGVSYPTFGSWASLFFEIGGLALVEGDLAAAQVPETGAASNPTTPPFTALDAGLVLVVMLTTGPSGTYGTPAGWNAEYDGNGSTTYFAVVSDTIAAAGAVPAAAWTGSVAANWLSLAFPVGDLALRVPDATGIAAAPAASLATPGSDPEPSPVQPFVPEVNPLPTDPEGAKVPLDPAWVPGPGPYRRS